MGGISSPVHQVVNGSCPRPCGVGKSVGNLWAGVVLGGRQLDMQPPSPPQRIFFLVLFLLEVTTKCWKMF